MYNLFSKIKAHFSNGSNLLRLLYINIGLFLIIKILAVFFYLFSAPTYPFVQYLELPSNLSLLMLRPWTLITYMFLHLDFLHLFFNMLCLYWFGKLFLNVFSHKQLLGVYLLGGILGGIVYIVIYNLFPVFQHTVAYGSLMGASASVMAIMVAVAVKAPNFPIRLLFLGEVKLKYIAIFLLLISFIEINSSNAGGELSHLGGALFGYLFALALRKGHDLTRWVSAFMDWFTNLFKKGNFTMKSKRTFKVRTNKKSKSDADYNKEKADNNREVDVILDKIKKSGYSSLTADEKKRLFDKSKNL